MIDKVLNFFEELPTVPSVLLSMGSGASATAITVWEGLSRASSLLAVLIGGIVVPSIIGYCKLAKHFRDERARRDK